MSHPVLRRLGIADPREKLHQANGNGTPRRSQASDAALAGITAEGPPWPAPLDEAAYHGLAGELVRTIEPHTEADPAAILMQFLACFGNVIGRSGYFAAEADRHYGNLFVCLVGQSSKGRKGSSLGQVLRPFRMVELESAKEWLTDRHTSGLSSGEGLIWAVRDEIRKRQYIKEKARAEDVLIDPGIEDKRLLVLEPEFASALRVLSREGNTLSAIIRSAWDNGSLQALTKNSPAKATDAHISIIGHITSDELRRYLSATEAGNGFGNRILWCAVKRSKYLPEGGSLSDDQLRPLAIRLAGAIEFASDDYSLREPRQRDAEARDLWHEVYPTLSDGKPGMFGAVTGRAEAQTMRMALLYSLLDCSPVIRIEHLMAGLAVWTYCEQSARWVFGDNLGDRTADELLLSLKNSPAGLTRTEIREVAGKNRATSEIAAALSVLQEHGLAEPRKDESTGGRPSERWFYTGRKKGNK